MKIDKQVREAWEELKESLNKVDKQSEKDEEKTSNNGEKKEDGEMEDVEKEENKEASKDDNTSIETNNKQQSKEVLEEENIHLSIVKPPVLKSTNKPSALEITAFEESRNMPSGKEGKSEEKVYKTNNDLDYSSAYEDYNKYEEYEISIVKEPEIKISPTLESVPMIERIAIKEGRQEVNFKKISREELEVIKTTKLNPEETISFYKYEKYEGNKPEVNLKERIKYKEER